MSADSEARSRAGILTDATGGRHIPSSVRADGSTRKEIKIRPGYKPPEDVEVYKNRTAESWKTRGTGGVPGAAANETDVSSGTAGSNKNAKRREARKKAKAKQEEEEGQEGHGQGQMSEEGAQDHPTAAQQEKVLRAMESENTTAAAPSEPSASSKGLAATAGNAGPIDPEAEKEKQVKRLQKRLRQARELMDKKDKGENLLPEQFEKVIKIQELTRQLGNLGFDANGERKQA